MAITCRTFVEVLESLAPPCLAESWDNIGLLVGNYEQAVQNIMTVLDVTRDTVEYAKVNHIDMIVAHHPLMFGGIKKICTNDSQGWIISELIKNNIGVYVAHTNWDAAKLGVNYHLAQLFSLKHAIPLHANDQGNSLVKLVVFVPEDYAEKIRKRMMAEGAGHIGNYSECSFQIQGVGSFLPQEGSNPFLGRQGIVEHVRESRVETIMPRSLVEQVVRGIKEVHPYEEVAYDVYPLLNHMPGEGIGRVGNLATPVKLEDLVGTTKEVLGALSVKVSGDLKKNVQRIALCGGSGASFIHAALKNKADVYITGDIRYHEAQEALEKGMAIIDAGHFATEDISMKWIAQLIRDYAEKKSWDIGVQYNNFNSDIFQFC